MKFKEYMQSKMNTDHFLIESNSMKIIKKGENPNGVVFALVQTLTGNYTVWKINKNYSGHVRGGIAKTWGYVTPKKMSFQEGQNYAKNGISFEEAERLYNKKLKSTVKN